METETNAGVTIRTLLVLLVPAVLLACLLAAYVVLAGLDPSAAETEARLRAALPYLIALNHGLVLGALVVLLRREGRRMRDIGWSLVGTNVAREIAVALAVGLGLYLFKELAIDALRAVIQGQRPTFTSLFRFRPADLEVPLAVVATGLVFVEESLYRGWGLGRLRGRLGLPASILVTSVPFGLLHWGNGPFAVGATAVLGALLALVFVWRRNLLAPTVAHAIYNLLVLLT